MRHILVNAFLYVLALLLVVGSLVFAWTRHAQLVISDERTASARFEAAPARAFEWRELGATAYAANCRRCHGARGQGWDQYPGLRALGALIDMPDGRDYLIALHLWGVDSDRWRAPMPPMGHMPDPELAAAINHTLTHFGNELPAGMTPIAPEELRRHREHPRSPAEVARMRPTRALVAR